MLLPKQAEQLRRTVCDVTYPESPPNKRLVLVLEEMVVVPNMDAPVGLRRVLWVALVLVCGVE